MSGNYYAHSCPQKLRFCVYLGVRNRSLPWQVHLLQRPVEDPLKSQGEAASLGFQGWSHPSWAGGAQQGGCKLFTRLYSLSFLICSHTRHPQCPMEGAFRLAGGGCPVEGVPPAAKEGLASAGTALRCGILGAVREPAGQWTGTSKRKVQPTGAGVAPGVSVLLRWAPSHAYC